MFSWIADGSKLQFSVKASSTSLRDVLMQTLVLRNIAAESGICFASVLVGVILLDSLPFISVFYASAGNEPQKAFCH